MSLPKKSIAILLTVTLISSLFGGLAFAEEESFISSDKSELADQAQDIATSEEQSNVIDKKAVEDPLGDEATEVPGSTEGVQDANDSRGLVVDEILAAGYEYKEAVDVVEYVYLESTLISLKEEQNIVVGLLEGSTYIESASLVIERINSGDQVLIESASVVEIDALFSFVLTEKEEATAYQVLGVQLDLADGSKLYADLTSDTVEENTYIFDVVTEEVAEALTAGKSDGDVSVFALEDDGSLVAASSVPEAVQIADEEGVSTHEEGESIVDQDALAQGLGTSEEEAVEKSTSFFEDAFAWFTSYFGPTEAYAAASETDEHEPYVIIALDPGHGGSDGGAGAGGYNEKDINLAIAQYCEAELKTYSGVTTWMTRTSDVFVGLEDRVRIAAAVGADVFVSIHCNSTGTGSGTGAEVWIPNSGSYKDEGAEIGNNILSRLEKLGLSNRGVKTRLYGGDATYSDGSPKDWYSVIRNSREAGIPGIIVEHGFMDNPSDLSKLIGAENQKKLGMADASGLATSYGLVKDSVAQSTSTVKARAHISNVGWLSYVYDQKTIGTTGKGFGLESFQLSTQNTVANQGGITYRSCVKGAWQNWESNGGVSGTIGKSTPLEAVQIELTGAAANNYDVYYRVHVANTGWLGWAKNGASAGSKGYNYQAEAMQVVIVAKGAAAPGDTTTPYKELGPTVSYQAHVSFVGWQSAVSGGSTAGTTGTNKAIEALKISLKDVNIPGSISYETHVSNVGWQKAVTNGAMAGTTGQSKQVEAVKINLTGDIGIDYDVYYRVYSKGFGWLDWAKNGQVAGTSGYGYHMEAIQIKLIKKAANNAPGATANPSRTATLKYSAHVSYIGWQNAVHDGATAGTEGQSRAVEALTVALTNQAYAGNITYETHVSSVGWQSAKSNGAVSGTTGQSKQVEAVRVKLTGEMANKYDVYYRVHSRNFGWLDWAKNGAEAGTSGYGYRMEAIQIKLVTKNGDAPGATSRPYVQPSPAEPNQIMGSSQTTVAQMVARWNVMGKTYPSSVYAKYGAADITQFCTILLAEANYEGVRAEVVFAQAMHETGWLQFGGDVKAEQCNFAGIGATGGVPGNSFNDWGAASVHKGLRAQVQHLKAYASTDKLLNPCIDPRFSFVTRGCAPTIQDLGGKWATGSGYGTALTNQVNALLAC